MSKSFFYGFIFVCSIIFFSSPHIKAQNQTAFDEDRETTQTKQPKRPNLLRELDLTPDQIRRIRRLNQERRAEKQAAQQRLKDAREALDAAIYADRDNDAEVQARVRELHAARLEVLKNRVGSEQSVRRILTPQQLGKFRRLRQQYNQGNSGNTNVGNGLNRRQNRNLTPQQQRRLNRIENRQRRQANP